MYLIFDTETTGLPQNWKAPLTDFDNWPRLVQLAWQVHDIPFNASKIHGISTERAMREGVDLSEVLEVFMKELKKAKFVVGHNIGFDNNIVGCEFLRKNMPNLLQSFPKIDTKNDATDFCKIPGGRGGAGPGRGRVRRQCLLRHTGGRDRRKRRGARRPRRR